MPLITSYMLLERNLESNCNKIQFSLARWIGQMIVPNVLIASVKGSSCN